MVKYIACSMLLINGDVLLVKRKDNNLWSFPGGYVQKNETALSAALRETYEETKIKLNSHINSLQNSYVNIWEGKDNFVSFFPFELAVKPDEIVLNQELTEYKFFPIDDLPHNRMDTVDLAIEWLGYDENDIAKAIAKGVLASPQFFNGNFLFDMRITGTEIAVRGLDKDGNQEITYRNPEVYLGKKFISLCQGVKVVFNHPEKTVDVDTEYLRNRQVGTIIYPYILGNEVWGIAKIFNIDFGVLLMQHHYSTSPSVTNRKNFPVKINKNLKALYEGSPFVVDHLAIVDEGVWDKDGRAIPGVNSPINHVLKKGTQIIMPDENQLSSQLSDLKAKIEKLLGMEEGHSARDRRRDRRDNVDDDLSNNIKKLHDAYDSAVEYDKKNDLRRDDIDQIEDALDVCRDAIKKDQRRRDAARRRDDDNSNDRRDGRDGDNEINKDRCDRRNRNDAAEDNSDIVKQLKENTEAVRMLCETLKQNSTVAEDKKKDGAMKVNGEAGNSEGEKKLEAQREGEGIAGESAKKDEGEDKDNLDKKIKDGIAESKLLSKSKNDAMDKEKDKISSIFSKCDTAYQYLRLDRPQPFNFESASEFARRALKPLIAHSDEWSKIGMDKIVDNEILISKAITDSTQAIVDGVRKDAKKNNRLSEVVDGDASLTRKTTVRYEGDSKAFLDQFSTPTKVAKISYIPKIH